MKTTSRTLVLAGVLLAGLAVCGPAFGAWAASGTASGSATATSLVAPTSPSAVAVVATSSAIDVAFTPATNPSGTTYTVTRDKTKTGAPGPQVACSGLTASPCHDTGLAASTTYTYTVKAVLGSWSQAGATTASATTSAAVAITVTSCTDDGPTTSPRAAALTRVASRPSPSRGRRARRR